MKSKHRWLPPARPREPVQSSDEAGALFRLRPLLLAIEATRN